MAHVRDKRVMKKVALKGSWCSPDNLPIIKKTADSQWRVVFEVIARTDIEHT